jgi:putative endonuclease
MYYVYILRSRIRNEQTYVGFTTDVQGRLAEHNQGGSPHTSKFKPWDLVWHCAFPDKMKAIALESYLKSHSGKAFANKRLL